MAAALACDDHIISASSRRSTFSGSFREMWQAQSDVFSQSSHRMDDEEELRWAAIERLPTRERLRKGVMKQVLDNGKVVSKEIDVTSIGYSARKQLMNSILKVVEEDNEKFLLRLRQRIDRVGIEIPKIEVQFDHLSVKGEVHTGSRALPSLLNATLDTIESILGLIGLAATKKHKINILQDVSGKVKPSRMTLLLGPPGAGKTTLLLALAGKLDSELRATAVAGQNTSLVTDYVLKILGLDICADIMVGDDMRRGISGGQKKRATTGEMCPERKGVADFLQEVTSRKDQEQYWFRKNQPFRYVTCSEFAEAFYSFHIGEQLASDLSVPYVKSENHPAALATKRYGISNMELFKACFAREWLLMKPWAFALPIWILKIPVSLMESAIWIILTYYTIGFAPGASRFFMQFLAFFGIHQMGLSLFRFIAVLGRTQIFANTLGSFTLLLVFVLGGFVVSKNDIKPWMAWAYYASPMMYGQNAIVMNEFLDKRWSAPNIDPRIDEPTVGKVLLKSRGFFTEEYWFWICIGALFGFSLIFNVLFIAALAFLNPFAGDSKAVVEVEHGKKMSSTEKPEGTYLDVMNTSQCQSSTVNLSDKKSKRGMILPYTPLSLAFSHVNYYVDMPSEMKTRGVKEERLQLLRDISDVTTETRKAFVEEIMDLVELDPIRHALVGLPGVGLDARAAAIVMRTVRNTVDTGRTVVCTIHQPGIDIFESFDELLLMKKGGQVIYAGALGVQSQSLIEYFEAVPGVPKIEEGYNPATWMLEVTADSVEARLDIDFAEIYANSSLYQINQKLIEGLSNPPPGSQDLFFPTKYSQPFITQCRACFWKQNWSYWRSPQYNTIRLFLTIFIGIMFGVIFWDMGNKMGKQQDLLNLLGAMYAAVLFLGATNASSVQAVVAIERTVFYRERAAGMYSEFPYAFAQVAIETIYVAIQTGIYTLILYSMIGFEWTATKFLMFYYFMFMCFLYFTMYGMMVVALTPGHQIAAIVMSFFLSFWNLFSGFLIPRPQIPIWWRWYYWASPVAWTIYGLVVSQVGDQDSALEDASMIDLTRISFNKCELGFTHIELGVLQYVGQIIGFENEG
ncbi:Pleiotropic drug resistance 6 [Heracleum sosnowskyi]|uniref:Pleiotropic drug resistance 6 n=1 Tax=Heracleum sosnowskyi TaxID=360622 RepID=A0AAD8N2H1_9APIA|nr:Pleiotropic drug resistance 6 [Heracleum sosnowskyi]